MFVVDQHSRVQILFHSFDFIEVEFLVLLVAFIFIFFQFGYWLSKFVLSLLTKIPLVVLNLQHM